MKTLLVGLLVFCAWSSLATYIYVCKIKGFCYETVNVETGPVGLNTTTANDTLQKPSVQKQPVIPNDLLINFEFDKSEFNADAESNKYFEESDAFLNQNAQAWLSITGHTDAVGTNAYNLALGNRRAQCVQHYFESKGMPANKIVIESKGESEPVDDNKTKDGRANNRRTVITIKK